MVYINDMPQREKPLNAQTLPQLNDYLITNNGEVWTNIRNRYLKGLTKDDGYTMYYLKDNNGNSKWYYAHRLVAMLYVPNPGNKSDVDHIDNDRSNNNYTNLQWVTHAENIQLAYTRGGKTALKGKDHPLFNKPVSNETRTKQSAKKMGENHPKFKGHYKYDGQLFASIRELAEYLNTYYKAIQKLISNGSIEFIPK